MLAATSSGNAGRFEGTITPVLDGENRRCLSSESQGLASRLARRSTDRSGKRLGHCKSTGASALPGVADRSQWQDEEGRREKSLRDGEREQILRSGARLGLPVGSGWI